MVDKDQKRVSSLLVARNGCSTIVKKTGGMCKIMRNAKIKVLVMLAALLIVGGCISKEDDPFKNIIHSHLEQVVTPLKELSIGLSPCGVSTTPNGAFFGGAGGDIFFFNNKGELLWTKDVGSRYALLLDNGTALLAGSYNKKESWKSTIIKFDFEGNILWERQTGLIGVDGLAMTSDGSFIAVGATDQEKKGHVMLFDGDGNKLWDHQVDGRVETVAVSKNGYVVAGPRDRYIYVYNRNGELISEYYASNYSDSQDTAIASDESYFLFASGHKYLSCFTLQGEFLWQQEVGPLYILKISTDSEYIAVGTTDSRLLLIERNGTILWDKKVTDEFYVIEVAISGHGEYVVVPAQKGFIPPTYAFEVYSREGNLLWRYEEEHPFKALAISDDGHYLVAGSDSVLLFFDNFAAIEEYASNTSRLGTNYPFFHAL
jgi:hypothetical protein